MILLEQRAGAFYEHDDGKFRTSVSGFNAGAEMSLPVGRTHFGVVVEGSIELSYPSRIRRLFAGDYFSVSGAATILSQGSGVVLSAHGYDGINCFGGPIEAIGRLRYIDGCTDSLLIPPVRRGDPCLNHLHFPPGIVQTPHTHPSVRAGVVLRGSGVCVVPGQDPIPLVPGCIFVIPTDGVHSFNTSGDVMDVIAYHPDSDTGPTDDDHPMVNRTIVDGVSANRLDLIRTR